MGNRTFSMTANQMRLYIYDFKNDTKSVTSYEEKENERFKNVAILG